MLGERVQLTVAGRTDAGRARLGAGRELRGPRRGPARAGPGAERAHGDDLTVHSAEPASNGFDARHDARSRTYCYRVVSAPAPSPFERGLSLFWPHKVYPGLLERCAEALPGTHDFTAFTPTQTEHVRFERDVLRAEWKRGRSFGH